jgi:ubiquinone/menaquinone biosynthesis C-methylase UbiE
VTALAGPFAGAGRSRALPYAHLPRAERYIHRTRDEALLELLESHGVRTLAGYDILEVGCERGSLLATLTGYGAETKRLHGIDISSRSVGNARQRTGLTQLAVADGALLPYRDATFDLAFLFTSFSSMIDADVRRHAAKETMRVLRPGGVAVVYDFLTNPTNARVRPVGVAELRRFFAPRALDVRRVTLAPPLVRLLGGHRGLCRPLESVPFLRTHVLAAVRRERDV